MCEDCGCSQPNDHAHTHTHDHKHGHKHSHERTVEVGRNLLERNDHIAGHNREWLASHGITTLNIISSPGAGKTTLLEKTLDTLAGVLPVAVIAGDQETDNDAQRLQGRGAPVMQIRTHSACHLSADQIADALEEAVEKETRILFIENVGNLVCPAAFDLGESLTVALLACTEGEDKPEKYPTLFSRADIVLLTKMDLAPHLDWDVERCIESIRSVNPDVRIIQCSARNGTGLQDWFDFLQAASADQRRQSIEKD